MKHFALLLAFASLVSSAFAEIEKSTAICMAGIFATTPVNLSSSFGVAEAKKARELCSQITESEAICVSALFASTPVNLSSSFGVAEVAKAREICK